MAWGRNRSAMRVRTAFTYSMQDALMIANERLVSTTVTTLSLHKVAGTVRKVSAAATQQDQTTATTA